MAASNVQTFTDANFDEEVLKNTSPVLVDFWAEWCGPCRRLAPIVDALAAEYDGRIVVGKMNIDDNPRVPIQYSIRGIPTLLLFKGGRIVEQVIGLTEKQNIAMLIDRHVDAVVKTEK